MAIDKKYVDQIVKVSEKAALASSYLVGKKDKIAADQAAVDAMRSELNKIDMNGEVVIGEGSLDEAPMLYTGEKLGNKNGPYFDIAVDPLEGTNFAANNLPGATSVIAIAEKGNLFNAPETYMDKIATGPIEKGLIEEVKITDIKDAIYDYIMSLSYVFDSIMREDLLEIVQQRSNTLFSEAQMEFVEYTNVKILKSDKNFAYFPFTNGVARVSFANGIELLDYTHDDIKNYEYLLTMPIYNVSKEKLDDLFDINKAQQNIYEIETKLNDILND